MSALHFTVGDLVEHLTAGCLGLGEPLAYHAVELVLAMCAAEVPRG